MSVDSGIPVSAPNKKAEHIYSRHGALFYDPLRGGIGSFLSKTEQPQHIAR
jgi:hypothetical protein